MSEAALLAEPAPTRPVSADTFEELYRRAFPRVYAYVATLLRDRSAAEEVTAQAFERAYRKRRTYKAGRGSAEAWLFGIARNAALDELRRRKRRAALEAEPDDPGAIAADRARRARAQARDRSRRAGSARARRARPRRPEVLRRAVERGDRRASSAAASRTPAPACTE